MLECLLASLREPANGTGLHQPEKSTVVPLESRMGMLTVACPSGVASVTDFEVESPLANSNGKESCSTRLRRCCSRAVMGDSLRFCLESWAKGTDSDRPLDVASCNSRIMWA